MMNDEVDDDYDDILWQRSKNDVMWSIPSGKITVQYTKQGMIFGYSNQFANREQTVEFLYKSLPPMYREQDRLKLPVVSRSIKNIMKAPR